MSTILNKINEEERRYKSYVYLMEDKIKHIIVVDT